MKTLLWSLLCCALGSATPGTENWDNADVTPLTAVNTPAMEYLPSLSESDGTLFFVSDRKADIMVHQEGGKPKEMPDNSQNVWMAERTPDNSYGDRMFAHSDFSRVVVNDCGVSRGIGSVTFVFATVDPRESFGDADIYSMKVTRPDEKAVVVETENIGD